MSKQSSKSNGGREPKRENHDRLSADIKDLYEASGHYGPWSSDDRAAAFGVVEVERTSEPVDGLNRSLAHRSIVDDQDADPRNPNPYSAHTRSTDLDWSS